MTSLAALVLCAATASATDLTLHLSDPGPDLAQHRRLHLRQPGRGVGTPRWLILGARYASGWYIRIDAGSRGIYLETASIADQQRTSCHSVSRPAQ